MDNNIKVVYNKFESTKFNQGYIDLNNPTIKNKYDLINVCNIFRDPRYETFRIFYIRDSRIIAQEAFTDRLPDGVFVFNNSNGDSAKFYKKMNNRIERLNADGYYLAHNHPSGIAEASEDDMRITYFIDKHVKGFLGHIILGSYNRYSIIEKNNEGYLLIPQEQILENSTLEKVENDSFYNMKIKSREDLVAILIKMQNEQEYSSVILTDIKTNIRMILDIPNKMFNQNIENLNGFFKNLGRKVGATRIFIGTYNQKTYFKIIEHYKFGTFKDVVFIDSNRRIVAPKAKDPPDLFDKEKKLKSHKNRDAR